MLDLTIITIGKLKDKAWLELSEEYLKRLKLYARIKLEELPALSFSEDNRDKIKKEESQRILEKLEKYEADTIWLLDERGKEFTSQEFANVLLKNNKLVLVIAGSLGFSLEILEKYSQKLSLSKLTFIHEMARVVLLEQLYRGATILNNKTYHY